MVENNYKLANDKQSFEFQIFLLLKIMEVIKNKQAVRF